MSAVTYRDVQRMIWDGVEAAEIERVLSDERTALTDAQIADLRATIAAYAWADGIAEAQK